MSLILDFSYPNMPISEESGGVNFTKIVIRMRVLKEYEDDVTFMIGNVIPLTTAEDKGPFTEKLLPFSKVFRAIYRQMALNSEKYCGDRVMSLSIRIMCVGEAAHAKRRTENGYYI